MSASPAVSSPLLRLLLRAALLLLALSGVLALAAVFFLDALARIVATPILADYGVRLQAIEQISLSRHQIRIANIRFLAPDSRDESLIKDLTLDFDPAALLEGRFQRLHIALADINLDSGAATSANTGSSSGHPAATLPALPPLATLVDTMQALPGEAVSIDSLRVAPYLEAGRLTVTRDARELRMLADSSDLQLDLRLNWQNNDTTSTAPEAISGKLLASVLDENVLRSDFTLTETGSALHWDAHSEWQLATLTNYLQTHELMPPALSALQGQLRLNTHLTLPTPDPASAPIVFSWEIETGSNASVAMADTGENPVQTLHLLSVNPTLGDGEFQWPADLRLNASAPALTLTLKLRDSDAPATLLLGLDSLSLNCQLPDACQGHQATSLRVPGFALPGITAEEVVAISNGDLALENGNLRMVFATGSRFELGKLQMPDLEIRQFNALVQDSLSVTDNGSGLLQLSSNGLDLVMPDIIQAGMASHAVAFMSELNGELSLEEPAASRIRSQVTLRNLGSDFLPLSLRMPELDLRLDMADHIVHTDGMLRLANRDILHVDNRLDLRSTSGHASINVSELAFSSGDGSLSAWFFRPPFNADVISGSVQASAELDFAPAEDGTWLIDGPLTVITRELSGFYEDTAIVGVSVSLQGELRQSRDFVSTAPGRIDIERIDPGVPVEHIGLGFDINTPATQATIKDITASLFGGTVSSPGLTYDWSAEENHLAVRIDRLDISRMLALAAYDSVQATGYISGNLPITLRGTTPSIGAGSLAAETPGGAIRYRSATGNTGNPALDFVNQALSNYQYSLLDTTVDYRTSGELALAVRLQGLNPDVNNGQRINLNLNISDNIPDLLRSLQAGRSIADTLERQLDAR